MADFWDIDNFDFADAGNGEIWSESPGLQREIQPPQCLRAPGSIGAQQAMLESGLLPDVTEESVLPWVPDLVGKKWKNRDSLLIVGSSYGAFIRELSGPDKYMALSEYVSADSVEVFTQRFLRDVVQSGANHYARIAALALHTGLNDGSQVAILELCRASFVERDKTGHGRRDKYGDRVVQKSCDAFSKYIDAGKKWTLQRIADSEAFRIVALGKIAEHGLLRLFHEHGMQIGVATQAVGVLSRWIPHPAKDWPLRYADRMRNLGWWLRNKRWWAISGRLRDSDRTWYLLPVHHPVFLSRASIAAAASILRLMSLDAKHVPAAQHDTASLSRSVDSEDPSAVFPQGG